MPNKKKKSTSIKAGDASIGIGGNVNNSQINHNYHTNEPFQKRPDLTKLLETRDKGYLLRNEGLRINKDNLESWLLQVKVWSDNMKLAVSEIDEDKGKLLNIMGNIPRNSLIYHNIIDDRHYLVLDIFNERLRRLDNIIEDYLKLPK